MNVFIIYLAIRMNGFSCGFVAGILHYPTSLIFTMFHICCRYFKEGNFTKEITLSGHYTKHGILASSAPNRESVQKN